MPKKYGNKYSTAGLTEAEFEPGSGKRVLRNRLGLKSRLVIEKEETLALVKTEEWASKYFSRTHRFTESDVRKIHRIFLGKIYAWAGNYRNVNITKGGFPFAAAREIPHLMEDFSRKVLAEYTPCIFRDREKIITAIAVVHAELLLIHPFREGNGRLARLLANLMAFQANLPSLDFGIIKGKMKIEYYRAIQKALGKNYKPIKNLIKKALQRDL